MSKKLYKIDAEVLKTCWPLHPKVSNPTCVAIIKTMMKFKDREMAGDEILRKAVEIGNWSTRQAEERYSTTWDYYVKKLKTYAGVRETGKGGSSKIDYDELFKDLFAEQEMEKLEEQVEELE